MPEPGSSRAATGNARSKIPNERGKTESVTPQILEDVTLDHDRHLEFTLSGVYQSGSSPLRVGEREYDVRHRRSAEIVARAGYTLGIIERVVLPSDGALARELLGELLDAEQQIAEQAYEDDYGAEELFARVRSLLRFTPTCATQNSTTSWSRSPPWMRM